jgi:hypothetical protein
LREKRARFMQKPSDVSEKEQERVKKYHRD